MEFLEALRQAKEVGLSEADFKVQWDKEREREEKNKEREEKNKEREEKDKERGERQKEREYNLQKIQKELAEVGGSVTTVKQEVGSVKGPRIPVFVDNRFEITLILSPLHFSPMPFYDGGFLHSYVFKLPNKQFHVCMFM